MDIFIPFFYEKEKYKENFEQLSLIIDEPFLIEKEDDSQDEKKKSNSSRDNVI